MGVTAPSQDVSSTHEYFTLLLVKGPPPTLWVVPACYHLLTLPILFTSP